MAQTFVANPTFLHLNSPNGQTLYGCDQDWFRGFWQRKAGCGPCTLANIMLYLARAGLLNRPLAAEDPQSMLPIMEAMWKHVTPGMMGLNATAPFVTGANQALAEAGSALRAQALDIEKGASQKEAARISAFVETGLKQAPVAFLSLLRQQLGPLEPWHWVTVAGISRLGDDTLLHIYDNTHYFDLRLKEWLEAGGVGGFVAFL